MPAKPRFALRNFQHIRDSNKASEDGARTARQNCWVAHTVGYIPQTQPSTRPDALSQTFVGKIFSGAEDRLCTLFSITKYPNAYHTSHLIHI
jgi:hypothetical protein